MSNQATLLPPQLSSDGRWRWDGQQWVPTKPASSKRPGLPGPGAPQLSSDGHWWWNGYNWAPAKPTSSTSEVKPRRAGALAFWALFLGGMGGGAAVALMFGTQAGVEGWTKFSPTALIITPAVCAVPGLVLGILALVTAAVVRDRGVIGAGQVDVTA